MIPARGHGGFGDAEDERLLKSAADWDRARTLGSLTVPFLQQLAHTEGLDFAAAVLHDRLMREPANAAFANAVQSGAGRAAPEIDLVGIVPGAFYREHEGTGADGRRVVEIAAQLNLSAEVIPVNSFGSLAVNARIILDWLKARRARRILFVSLSKGAADLKTALTAADAEAAFSNVVAWLSLSGMAQGTPLVDWMEARPLRHWAFRLWLRWHGQQPAVMDELRRADDGLLARWPALPAGLRVVHVYGFPMKRHLRHRWAPRAYERLAPLGPNDGGGVLLGDTARLPGIVFPIWGADHYLAPAWDSTPLLRSVALASVARENFLHATASAQ